MHVVDADASLLEVPGLLRRQRPGRVEPALEAVDVAGSPGARLAVGAVPASLRVVVVVGDVPVADVDHVEDAPAVLAAPPTADRLLEEQPERAGGHRLGGQSSNALSPFGSSPDLAEQHRPHDRLRQRQPALGVEQEVVLEALRDEDVARLAVLRPLLRFDHRAIQLARATPVKRARLPRRGRG